MPGRAPLLVSHRQISRKHRLNAEKTLLAHSCPGMPCRQRRNKWLTAVVLSLLGSVSRHLCWGIPETGSMIPHALRSKDPELFYIQSRRGESLHVSRSNGV
jgi:hypothetical protein